MTQHDKWLKKEKTVQFKDLGLLFTCSTSREIHLEVVMQINTEQIIMALERFVSRRGLPVAVYSDNGTQLKKASKEVATLWKAATESCVTPHKKVSFGNLLLKVLLGGEGVYERMVGTMKSQLCKVIDNALLTVKEFQTFLCKVEANINSWPILNQFSTGGEPSFPINFISGSC